ncbi:hypothetical protein [Saccharopolyspora gloriosae]|uniref:hypothetical protein n=1 Tax=Saccharopolyspora gloriosae TaxID=455344 RepID=UPI001FB60FB4|nr:hypothetical protein [Saccharopolyspora gloriosae]
MAEAVDVALLPIRLGWRLVKLLLLPVLFGAGSIGLALLGMDWMFVVAVLCAVWGLIMARLWWLQLVGELRSLGRGTVHVRAGNSGRGKGGRL